MIYNGKLPLKLNEKAWLDRNYRINIFPGYLTGGFFIQQPHKSIRKGTDIKIAISGGATIYVAVETGRGRSGGYEKSLLAGGWTKQDGTIAIDSVRLNRIFSLKTADDDRSVTLPSTTTNETVMFITVVSNCPGNF